MRELAESAASGMDGPRAQVLRERMAHVAGLMEQAAQHMEHAVASAATSDLRARLVPAYEHLAATLQGMDVHVPALRPKNHARKLFHVHNGVLALLLVHHVLRTELQMLAVAAGMAGLAWTLELGRRRWTAMNDWLMTLFSNLAHPHERWRVNSGTWYCTALLIVASMQDRFVITLALMVLAFGDAAAAVIGRRYGRVRLANGKSLEGTLGFIGVSTLACVAAVAVYYPDVRLLTALCFALGTATPAALAELTSRRIDDNLSVPVAAVLGALASRALLGL